MKCPQCGKFLKNVQATVLSRGPGDSDQTIEKVEGDCKKHGTVEANDWSYEDFFPPSS